MNDWVLENYIDFVEEHYDDSGQSIVPANVIEAHRTELALLRRKEAAWDRLESFAIAKGDIDIEAVPGRAIISWIYAEEDDVLTGKSILEVIEKVRKSELD